jgi:hypothetical protein
MHFSKDLRSLSCCTATCRRTKCLPRPSPARPPPNRFVSVREVVEVSGDAAMLGPVALLIDRERLRDLRQEAFRTFAFCWT